MQLCEVKKEDDLYFQGAFWILVDSLKDMFINNNITIVGEKLLSDFNGDYQISIESFRSLTHKRIWLKIKEELNLDVPYNYYPRGRVGIKDGIAYINLPEICIRAPHLIDMSIDYYGIDKLEIEIVPQNDDKMDNYGFEVK